MTTCATCSRYVFQGGNYPIEAAKLQDGFSPVVEPMLALKDSSRDAEVERWADIEVRFEQLSAYGELEQPREHRSLNTREDLWEIKTPLDRIGYYYRDATKGVHGRAFRLTHMWQKENNMTATGALPQKQMNFGDKIIREDKASGT